jgi:hypothetical protein
MAQVILFGGGDAGGLIIGPNGVRPIPPFDPYIRLQLRGLSAMLAGITRIPEKTQREMAKLVNRVSNLVMEQVEAVVGRLEGDNSLIYQDEDGGFTCGSTGKPPIPIPWPPLQSPTLTDLIATGAVEHELVDFVKAAGDQKISITDVLEKPAEVAGKLGRQLSERTIKDLQQLAPSRLSQISDPTEREVLQFFHKVAGDGRFLSTWATRPTEAATALKMQLSDKAFERIVAGGSSTIFDPGTAMNPIAVAVAVGVVIMLVTRDADFVRNPVKDRSGIAKF